MYKYDGKQIAEDPTKARGERPDNPPICPITDGTSTSAFVTLREHRLLVVNVKNSPMTVTTTLPINEIYPAGGGCPIVPFPNDLYAIDPGGLPDSVTTKLRASRDAIFSDTYGL